MDTSFDESENWSRDAAISAQASLSAGLTRDTAVSTNQVSAAKTLLAVLRSEGPVLFWLRHETKRFERRTPLTPTDARVLIAAGARINVERSPTRIFTDDEYEKAGCYLVPRGSWITAPTSTFILGLKELPEAATEPLVHRHIMFGHCYKNQAGDAELLKLFDDGNGILYDLEFLHNEQGRRVAAFGYAAGYAGMAIALITWASQRLGQHCPSLSYFANKESLVEYTNAIVDDARARVGRGPSAIVFGALGRAGSGAVDMARAAGITDEEIAKWDLEETKAGGPFEEILSYDIMVNCIYLSQPIPPFLTLDMIEGSSDKKLSVVCDISCDTSNPNNPLPFLDFNTSFEEPARPIAPGVDAVSIDHTPTLTPRESSEGFSEGLLPYLCALVPGYDTERAESWRKLEALYYEHSDRVLGGN